MSGEPHGSEKALPAEFRLAAACAMWPPSDCRIEAIRTAAADPLDWHRFVRVIRRHQVIGLVHDGLTRARLNVPSEIALEIGTRAATLVRENLAMARESLRLQRLFDDADVPICFLKGATLAVLAFSNLGLRSSQDIDLLVSPETLPAATSLILQAGYQRFEPPAETTESQLRLLMPLRKDFGFVHRETGLRIELHWRPFANPHVMAESPLIITSQVVPVAGNAGLRTLGDEELFAYLCLHGALHWWNRLKWLADVNAVLVAAPEVERLVRGAEVRGAGRACMQAVLLCRRLLGTPLPDPLIATRAKGVTMRWLEATALKAMTVGQGEQDLHDIRFGTTRGSLSTFLLIRNWRYRLAELKLLLFNQNDVLTLTLPERLRFLYPFLRVPLWLWRHAIHRQWIAKRIGSIPTETL